MLYLLAGFANDLSINVNGVSSKPKSAFIHGEEDFPDDDSVQNGKKGNTTSNGDYALEGDSPYAQSEDELARNFHDSPTGRTISGSPRQDFSTAHFEKSSEADAETHR